MQVQQNKNQKGLTFVELIVSMLVISISLSVIFMMMTVIARAKSTVIVQRQAAMIAQYYLDEVFNQPYPKTACSLFKSDLSKPKTMCDFIKPERSIITDADGHLVADFKNYTISIDLSSLKGYLASGLLIKVTVFHPEINKMVFSAIKVNPYENQG